MNKFTFVKYLKPFDCVQTNDLKKRKIISAREKYFKPFDSELMNEWLIGFSG